MERLALAVFDIKPLQFSLEKKKGRKKVVRHSVKMCKGWKVSLSFFSEAISGFREKRDKCLSRNMGRLKLYLFFVIQHRQNPKWMISFFFYLGCAGDRDIFKAPVHFLGWWTQQQVFKKETRFGRVTADKACKANISVITLENQSRHDPKLNLRALCSCRLILGELHFWITSFYSDISLFYFFTEK